MYNKQKLIEYKEIIIYQCKIIKILWISITSVIFIISSYLISNNFDLKNGDKIFIYIFAGLLGILIGNTISSLKTAKLKLFAETCACIAKIEENGRKFKKKSLSKTIDN